jgi:hypothetical protein
MVGVEIVYAVLPAILYALAGLIEAVRKGEKLRWGELIKTVVVAFVAAGAISTQTADMVLEVTSTTAITYVLDKLLNALLRRSATIKGTA